MACGGSGRPSIAERTPAAAAPRNEIAFGAVDAAGASALYVVQPDGSELRKLIAEPQAVSFPRWSPDGASIAYTVGGGSAPGANAILRVYHFDGAISITVSDHVLAAGDEAPMAWSPDGTRIALIEATDGGRLRVFDVDKGELLNSPSFPATAVDWSSRDELAIVAQNDQSSPDVYVLKADGKDKRRLLARDGVEDGPSWSPDGTTVAFWNGPSVQLNQRALFALGTGDKGAKDLGPGTDVTWSSDGRLAYSRPETPGNTGTFDIYTRRIEDPQPAKLTQSITLDRWPSWSPASDAVAYLAEADPSTTFLCVTTLATADNTCFDLPGLLPGAPAWSPY